MSISRNLKRFRKSLFKPLGDWWQGQRDNHLVLLGVTFVAGLAMMLWALIFLLFLLPNAQQEANEYSDLLSWTWVALGAGVTLLIIVGPEFFHYLSHRNTLREILDLGSRAEFERRRKEAEDGAEMLGSHWRARLESKRVELGIRRSMPAGIELIESEGSLWFRNWLDTKESLLSKRFPEAEWLKDPAANRKIVGVSVVGLIAFGWNAIFGTVRHAVGEPRNMSLDLNAVITGEQHRATWAPHLDFVSSLLIVILAIVLGMTRPAVDSSSSEEEE